MKAAVVAGAVVLASAPAYAGHACHETSEVLGHQTCSRFGTGWSGPTLAWELGWTMQRVPLDAVDRETPTVHATSAAASGDVRGLRLRSLYDLVEHFYIVTDVAVGALSRPPLVLDPVQRTTMPVDATTSGWMFAGVLGAGGRVAVGPIVLRSELAFGARLAEYADPRVPATFFGQGGPILEARADASVWLSLHWSAGVMLATSLVEHNDTSITFGLAVHAFPYDGNR